MVARTTGKSNNFWTQYGHGFFQFVRMRIFVAFTCFSSRCPYESFLEAYKFAEWLIKTIVNVVQFSFSFDKGLD